MCYQIALPALVYGPPADYVKQKHKKRQQYKQSISPSPSDLSGQGIFQIMTLLLKAVVQSKQGVPQFVLSWARLYNPRRTSATPPFV